MLVLLLGSENLYLTDSILSELSPFIMTLTENLYACLILISVLELD